MIIDRSTALWEVVTLFGGMYYSSGICVGLKQLGVEKVGDLEKLGVTSEEVDAFVRGMNRAIDTMLSTTNDYCNGTKVDGDTLKELKSNTLRWIKQAASNADATIQEAMDFELNTLKPYRMAHNVIDEPGVVCHDGFSEPDDIHEQFACKICFGDIRKPRK